MKFSGYLVAEKTTRRRENDMSKRIIVILLPILALILACVPSASANFYGGHWLRTSMDQQLQLRVVDATNDPAIHDATVAAASEWAGWSPDLEFSVESGTCSTAWGVITPDMICIVPGDLSWSCCYWGYTLQSTDWFGVYIKGVQITLDMSRISPSTTDPALLTELVAHEMGHAIGLGHSAWPSLMYPWLYGQCCPSEQDLIDLHSLYGHAETAPSATITSFKPTSGKPGIKVTVTGTRFDLVTSATLNGQDVGPITHYGSIQVSFLVPQGASTGKIGLVYPTGTALSDKIFTVKR
jgi:hypothetical protein